MRPKPTIATRKLATICVFAAEREPIIYARAYLEPLFRVAEQPDDIDACDSAILIDVEYTDPAFCSKTPLLLCGSSVILLARWGVEGIAVAARPEYWGELEKAGLTPLPLEVYFEKQVLTCSDARHVRLALRLYRRLLICKFLGRCFEPIWVEAIKCGSRVRG